jgi:hypothetical protein
LKRVSPTIDPWRSAEKGGEMEEIVQLLAALLRIAIVPLVGYAVVRLGRRWPGATLTLLLALIAVGAGALRYVAQDGFNVHTDSRKMEFVSEFGRWCFAVGGLLVILGVPALVLVAIAREKNGDVTGPVGGQRAVVLFGYFMACAIFGMVLYSWLTGIVK